MNELEETVEKTIRVGNWCHEIVLNEEVYFLTRFRSVWSKNEPVGYKFTRLSSIVDCAVVTKITDQELIEKLKEEALKIKELKRTKKERKRVLTFEGKTYYALERSYAKETKIDTNVVYRTVRESLIPGTALTEEIRDKGLIKKIFDANHITLPKKETKNQYDDADLVKHAKKRNKLTENPSIEYAENVEEMASKIRGHLKTFGYQIKDPYGRNGNDSPEWFAFGIYQEGEHLGTVWLYNAIRKADPYKRWVFEEFTENPDEKLTKLLNEYCSSNNIALFSKAEKKKYKPIETNIVKEDETDRHMRDNPAV